MTAGASEPQVLCTVALILIVVLQPQVSGGPRRPPGVLLPPTNKLNLHRAKSSQQAVQTKTQSEPEAYVKTIPIWDGLRLLHHDVMQSNFLLDHKKEWDMAEDDDYERAANEEYERQKAAMNMTMMMMNATPRPQTQTVMSFSPVPEQNPTLAKPKLKISTIASSPVIEESTEEEPEETASSLSGTSWRPGPLMPTPRLYEDELEEANLIKATSPTIDYNASSTMTDGITGSEPDTLILAYSGAANRLIVLQSTRILLAVFLLYLLLFL